MNKIRVFLECFVTVTTGIVIIGALAYRTAPEAPTPDTLWHILAAAALCALATALFFPSEGTQKKRAWVGFLLHFVSLCVIMVVCGRWFGWVGPHWHDAAIMVGYVVLVYAFTTGIGYLTDKRTADAMNRKLRQKYADMHAEK